MDTGVGCHYGLPAAPVMVTRLRVEFEARQWVNTPYQHKGRVRGVAADCLFFLKFAEELGLKDRNGVPFRVSDYPDYDPQPKDGFIYKAAMERLIPKSISKLQRGDLVVTRYGRLVASHAAIVGYHAAATYSSLTLIHCNGLRVVEQSLELTWRRRILGAFEFPGVV